MKSIAEGKRNGDSKHPFLTSLLTLKSSVSFLSCMTPYLMSQEFPMYYQLDHINQIEYIMYNNKYYLQIIMHKYYNGTISTIFISSSLFIPSIPRSLFSLINKPT